MQVLATRIGLGGVCFGYVWVCFEGMFRGYVSGVSSAQPSFCSPLKTESSKYAPDVTCPCAEAKT